MRKILLFIFLLIANISIAQNVAVRIVQTGFSVVDPDGAGPATGSVTIQFELMATGFGSLPLPYTGSGTLGLAMGVSFAFQSALLMATPTNTVAMKGPLLSSEGWDKKGDNLIGNDISPAIVYGGPSFDKRMIILFAQNSAIANAPFLNDVWTPVAQVTYWTLGTAYPEGGYATPEVIPQNSLTCEEYAEYSFLSPNLNTPLPLGSLTLPVHFITFNAQCNNDNVLLKWKTSSEINVSRYDIQRSTNGTSWTVIGSVKASTTPGLENNYSYTDNSPVSNSFYRIAEYDIDGRISYTVVEKSSCDSKDGFMLWPNPVSQNLNISIIAQNNSDATIKIFDNKGALVKVYNNALLRGSNRLTLDIGRFTKGLYQVVMTWDNGQNRKTMSVEKL